MLRQIVILPFVFLSACGLGGTSPWGPADFSFADLRYTGDPNSACCGGAFSGGTVTEVSPTTGTGNYDGIMRGNLGSDYRNGTANVGVDFEAASVTVTGAIDFTGVATGDGIVSFNQTAPLAGSHFQSTSANGSVFGHLYGTNAEAVAGSITANAVSGSLVVANFIAQAQP